jgi:hypothetical protein
VIKDKFRTGLNPQEKVKLEKEPMGLFMEDGIKELTKVPTSSPRTISTSGSSVVVDTSVV